MNCITKAKLRPNHHQSLGQDLAPISRLASPWQFRMLIIGMMLLSACEQAITPAEQIEVASTGIHSASLDKSGTHAIIGSINHGGSFWSLEEPSRLFNWNHDSQEQTTIIASDFSPDAKWAITANPHTLVLWNTETGKSLRYWTAPGEILDVKLGPNARLALLGLDDHSAVIFDIRKGGIKRTFPHKNRVRSVDLSDDGKFALTGSEDFSATLWDIKSGKQLFRLKHNDDVQLVKLSPDGKIALSVSKYDRALLWYTQSGETIGELPLNAEHLKRGIRFISASFSQDGKRLLTGRADQFVELWDTVSLEKLGSWKLNKRDAWKPTSAATLAVSFAEENEHTFWAAGSNGFVFKLTLDESE